MMSSSGRPEEEAEFAEFKVEMEGRLQDEEWCKQTSALCAVGMPLTPQ